MRAVLPGLMLLIGLAACGKPAPAPKEKAVKAEPMLLTGDAASLALLEKAAQGCGIKETERYASGSNEMLRIRLPAGTGKADHPEDCFFQWMWAHPETKYFLIGNEADAPPLPDAPAPMPPAAPKGKAP